MSLSAHTPPPHQKRQVLHGINHCFHLRFVILYKRHFLPCLIITLSQFGTLTWFLASFITLKSRVHCMKKELYFTKLCEKNIKYHIFLVFVCFRLTEILYFLNFPSNKNVRKQHLSVNAFSHVNMTLCVP